MKIFQNRIPLGGGIHITEFFLQPGEVAQVPSERETRTEKSAEMERLVEIYHSEDLLEIAGEKIPAVCEGSFSLDNISMQVMDGEFSPCERFKTAINARRARELGRLTNSGGYDGKNVGVRDWNISNGNVEFVGQAMYYTQFRSTDASQDEPLNISDKSFPDGATLRDYVVVNGKESRKGTDILSNLLGAAFIARAKNMDGQDCFVLGRRQKGRTSEGGELSIIGGTPMWEEEFFCRNNVDKKVDFPNYMRRLGIQECREELLLQADEIQIGRNVSLVRTFVRSFDPFHTVDIDPDLTVEDIAGRCYGNPEALKEHDRLYAVPRTLEALQALIENNRGFSIGQGTLAGLYLDITRDEKPQKV